MRGKREHGVGASGFFFFSSFFFRRRGARPNSFGETLAQGRGLFNGLSLHLDEQGR